MIRLSRGPLVLELAPQWGGGVSRFTYDGVDVLRPWRGEPANPQALALACFPLAPYANRIARGRFAFGGRHVALEANLDGQPHPLHGHGWLAPWRTLAVTGDSAVLGFDHAGAEWPWPYSATQRFELSETGLRLTLTMTNLAPEPAPAGLGFHPYFPDRGSARLMANLQGVWGIDADYLPTAHHAGRPIADWTFGAPVARPDLIDHCHTGWDGRARIDLPDRGLSLTLTASAALGWLHVYSPPGQDFFCVEPVSHRPDAVNAPDPVAQGLRILAPGEAMTVWMSLDVAPP